MRLTRFTDFGLRALMHIAAEPDRSHSTAEIASMFRISRHHLTKSMAALSAAGFIKTQRGTGGGAVLAKPADQLRLGDIVTALESRSALAECFAENGGACVITPACRLKGILWGAKGRFIEDLNRYSLADIALAPDSLIKHDDKR